MSRLVVTSGVHAGQVFHVESLPALIGRGPPCHIRVDEQRLSRQHAELFEREGQLWIRDLGSANGTYLNGIRVPESPLRIGDQLRMAKVTFQVEDIRVPDSPNALHEISSEDSITHISFDELLARHARERAIATSPEARLEVLLKTGQLLSSPEPLAGLLNQALPLIPRILPVDRAVIVVRDPESGALVPGARWSDDGAMGAGFSRQIVEYVMGRRVAALFAHPDEEFEDDASIVREGVQSSMCAPLLARGALHGALYVDSVRSPALFRPEDLAILDAFAAQVALAMDNVALVHRLQSEALRRRSLQRYFAPNTVEKLMNQGAELEATETVVTAVFCDLTGFTQLASILRPLEVKGLLDLYLPAMAEIVFAFDGTLEKFAGDALLAVWGAPFGRPDDAQRAVAAAQTMQRQMLKVQEAWGRPIQAHIGIHTGLVAAGNVGSGDYLQYVTVGNTTNLAARVCSRATAGQILVSGDTAAQLGSIPRASAGWHELKGLTEVVELFEIPWDQR